MTELGSVLHVEKSSLSNLVDRLRRLLSHLPPADQRRLATVARELTRGEPA